MRREEPMTGGWWTAIIVSVVVAGALGVGCAKRPALTAVSAPAPTLPPATAATPADSSTSGSEAAGKGVAGKSEAVATTPGAAAGTGTSPGGPAAKSGVDAGSSQASGAAAGTPAIPPATPPAVAAGPAPAPPVAVPEAPTAAPPAVPTGAERPPTKEFTVSQDLKDINFDFDRYDIRPDDAKVLDAHSIFLKSNDVLLLIEGHCDERGTAEYNLALGERRARATMNYLVSQGVQADRLTIVSYGEEQPLCREHSEDCWATNRRAHFRSKPR